MALPKQVEQQMREVEEMERQMQPVAETETDDAPAEATTEAVVEEAPKAEAEVVELKTPEVDWQQRYKTLSGKYDAEVPRLHSQVKELSNQIQALIQQAEQAKQAPEPEQDERLVSTADEDAFGKDLIDVQRRVAKEVMREMVSPLQKELAARDAKIAAMEKALNKTSGDVNTMTFEQRLNLAIPDFNQVNTDPKWIAWLDSTDQYGEPRRAYAEYMYNNGNIEKIKLLVDMFKGENPAQSAQREQRQAELSRSVQPTRTASSTSAAPTGDRIYTEAEVSRLYEKVRQLYTSGKNEEASKLDDALTAAYQSGRVRG